METPYQAPLTPEQVAAISAGGGFAKCEDPTTHIQYQLIQVESLDVSDEYVRGKIEEAFADERENATAPFDLAAIKSELQSRLVSKHKAQN
jgi:hypothetical protein